MRPASSTALYRLTPEAEQALDGALTATAAYRLIGARGDDHRAGRPASAPTPLGSSLRAEDDWQDAAIEGAYYGPEPRPRYHMGSLGLMLGIGLAVFALLVGVVRPALAGAQASQSSRGLVLSGYTDLFSLTGAAEPAPWIDTTGSAQPEQNSPPGPVQLSRPYDLLARPSISVAQIERVLQKYGSPAAGLGQDLYDLGVKYGIDPAYALAFFVHESGCGTKGVARFTKSLGNIRWSEGYANYQGFRNYASWQAGMDDWYKLITDLYVGGWSLHTVDDIIPRYAPSGDGNDPTSYVASIKWLVDSWRGK